MFCSLTFLFFFFFNDTATTEIYTLSLHDALPICTRVSVVVGAVFHEEPEQTRVCLVIDASDRRKAMEDRKSTRLNSSHQIISYAVFCLKKKKKKKEQ